MFGLFKKKKQPYKSPVDQLLELCNYKVSVYNGVTYSRGNPRITSDSHCKPLDFKTDKWFKIRIGSFVSGYGDWGNGSEYTSEPVVELYVDLNSRRILRCCVNSPFEHHNDPRRVQRENALYVAAIRIVTRNGLDKIGENKPRLETTDPWLAGILAFAEKLTAEDFRLFDTTTLDMNRETHLEKFRPIPPKEEEEN